MTNVLYYKYKILIGETGYWIYRNPMHTLCNFSINFNLCAMAPHSSTFAWKIPWTEEPGRLQSMGLLRVGHDWATSLSLYAYSLQLFHKFQTMLKLKVCFRVGRRKLGGKLKREGICVHLWLICVVVWQKLTQHCNAIILQLKISFLKSLF